MEEQPGEVLPLNGAGVEISLRALEIVTLRLKMSGRSEM